jgi:hypothetical protein
VTSLARPSDKGSDDRASSKNRGRHTALDSVQALDHQSKIPLCAAISRSRVTSLSRLWC